MLGESKAIERLELFIERIDTGQWFKIKGNKFCFIGGELYIDNGFSLTKSDLSFNDLLSVDISEINE